MGQTVVVRGAQNLGGAIVDHFLGLGWNAAADPAALVQITGGSARRAMPGRGLWAAGAFATRWVP